MGRGLGMDRHVLGVLGRRLSIGLFRHLAGFLARNHRGRGVDGLASGSRHGGRRLVRLGYDMEKGTYGEPQIAGTTREQIEHFSGRSAQIEAYIKEKWGIDWRTLSREERNACRHMHEEAWIRTRKAKTVQEIEGLQDRWKAEARAVGLSKILPGKPGKGLPKETRRRIARDALSFAVDHHTERESAVGDGELLRTAFLPGGGRSPSAISRGSWRRRRPKAR